LIGGTLLYSAAWRCKHRQIRSRRKVIESEIKDSERDPK
jgi:hypothetical protein